MDNNYENVSKALQKVIMVRRLSFAFKDFMPLLLSISKVIKMLQDTLERCGILDGKQLHFWQQLLPASKEFKIVVVINYSVEQTENKSQNHALSPEICSHMPSQSREFSQYEVRQKPHCFVSKHSEQGEIKPQHLYRENKTNNLEAILLF